LDYLLEVTQMHNILYNLSYNAGICLRACLLTYAARNTLVQLMALYIDTNSHNAQRYRRTDGRTSWRCQ